MERYFTLSFSLSERDVRTIDEDSCVESKDGTVRVPLCSPPQLVERGGEGKEEKEKEKEEQEEEGDNIKDHQIKSPLSPAEEISDVKRIQRAVRFPRLPKLPPSSSLSTVPSSSVSEQSRDYSHLLAPSVSPPGTPSSPNIPSPVAGSRASSSDAPFYLSVLRYLMIEHLLSNVALSVQKDGKNEKTDEEEMDSSNNGEATGSRDDETHLHEKITSVSDNYQEKRQKRRDKTKITNYNEKEHENIMNNKNIPLDVLYLILTYIPYPYRSVRIRNAPHKEAMLLLQWMRYSGRFNFGCVRALDISKCGIDASDSIVLSNIIRDSPSLIKLCIGNNRLGADGLEILSKAFSSNSCNISAIHLEHNAIGPKGASVIAKILVGCKGLMSVSLGYNQLGPEIEPICNALCDCRCSLMTLDIANNYVGDNGAFCLAKALKSPQCTKTLKCVRVWDPSMTPAGGDMLVEALEHNKIITEMGIGDSALTKEARIKLNKALRSNRGIVETNDPLAQRRRHEVDLLYGADSVFSDTWFLIDERWLAEWRDFARENSDAPPPGKISNWRLVKSDGTPISGREKLRDYRGVCPKVYALFHSIYGGGPAIVRSKIDLYSEPVYYDLDTLLGDDGNL